MAGLKPKDFNLAIGRVITNVPEVALDFQKQVVFFGLERIVLKTPVDTGLARNNWQVRRRPNDNVIEATDPSGTQAITQGIASLGLITAPYGVISIFNNVAYIQFLEEGSSQQAPAGMVAASVPEIQAFATELGRSKKLRFVVA